MSALQKMDQIIEGSIVTQDIAGREVTHTYYPTMGFFLATQHLIFRVTEKNALMLLLGRLLRISIPNL